jgi:predicted anti-sigma-YlaC factor YlaD
MSCEYYRELISIKFDGELYPDEEKSLNDHLEKCTDCRTFERDIKLTVGLKEKVGKETIPDDIEKKILQNTVGVDHDKKSWLRSLGGYYRIPRSVVWIGMAAVIYLLGSSIIRPFQYSEPKPVVTVETASVQPAVRRIVLSEEDIISTSNISNPENGI